MPKLLVVDDDADLLKVVSESLSDGENRVETAKDGRSALDILAVSNFDAIILDVDLPDFSGFEICTKLRASKNMTPVIMLTGKAHIDDKEQGFDCGADDYLTKPFSLKELAARINALIRRATRDFDAVLKFADIELDTKSLVIKKDGQALRLLPIDHALLEFFMRHPHQVYSSEALLFRVWASDSEATDDAVRSSIKRLRRVIDDSSAQQASLIENYPRMGYCFGGQQK